MATHNLNSSGSEDQISNSLDPGPEDMKMKNINLTTPSSLCEDENASTSLKGASTSTATLFSAGDDHNDNSPGYGNTGYVKIQRGRYAKLASSISLSIK